MAATDRALYHCEREIKRVPTPAEWVRLGWEEVARVSCDEDLETLTLWGLLPGVPRRTVLDVRTGGSMALLARERIGATELVRTNVQMGEHGSAQVIGRRRPGSDELVWVVGLDSGGAHDTPDVRGVLDRALADLRGHLGV